MESGPKALTELSALVDSLENRLNLTVFCLSQSWGGLEQVAANDALDVGSLGLKAQVVCLENSPIHRFLATHKEVKVLPISFRPRNYFDLGMRSEMRRIVSEGSNLLHTHQTSILGSIVPWIWSEPSVAMIASRHIMNNHRKKSFLHRAIYRRVDALLVMSETLRRNIIETHAIAERKVKVVSLGLDFDRFDPERVDRNGPRAQWGADADTTVIGLVGRIDPAKGQATFIKAAAGLLKGSDTQQKLKFVIVGDETRGSNLNYLKDLKQMVAQFRLEDHVVFTGFQENIPEIMSALDVFVMPSRQEAFGLVAIEAMAMSCPVVISQGGSAEEIVGTGGALMRAADQSGATSDRLGLIMRPDDAFDLQQKLKYLLDHPTERVEMGKRARAHVLGRYDRKLRLRRTLEIYERALRRRRN
ncbi:MAG: glycosyltransferase family 4 protein [Bdellovibrionia bacterium]